MKKLGIALAALFALVGLIRCSESDSEVTPAVSDAEANAKVKEAEAAEAAQAGAKGTAAKTSAKSSTKTASKAEGKASPRHPASAKNSLFVVQIGAFKVKENADKLVKKLKDAGYPVRLESMVHSKNGELHLVRFEPTPNKAEAQDAIEKLKAKESLSAQLVTLPTEG